MFWKLIQCACIACAISISTAYGAPLDPIQGHNPVDYGLCQALDLGQCPYEMSFMKMITKPDGSRSVVAFGLVDLHSLQVNVEAGGTIVTYFGAPYNVYRCECLEGSCEMLTTNNPHIGEGLVAASWDGLCYIPSTTGDPQFWDCIEDNAECS